MKGHALPAILSSLFYVAISLPSTSNAADMPQNQSSSDSTAQGDAKGNATGSVKLPAQGDTLSNKLQTSGGTIKPPPTNDTTMVEPPPKTHDPMAIKPGTVKPGSSDQVPPVTPAPTPK